MFQFLKSLPKLFTRRKQINLASDQPDILADLQAILEELDQPVTSLREVPRRIELCHRALELVDREENPGYWGGLHGTLASSLMDNPQGPRADNLERAIEHNEQALEVFTRQAYPEDWAKLQHNLANAYRDRICGERADNLERAIEHCERAIEVRTRQAYPEGWAMTQNILASTYSERILGGRADNLEQAIEHYEQALEVYARPAYPEGWAMTQNNLAAAYSDRIRGERADNLEQAIGHYEQALKVYTRQANPELWAIIQHNLANTYSDRIRGKRADNLERAIEYFEQALEVKTRLAYPAAWAIIQLNLANTYSDRILGKRADNLERAIGHYGQALEVYTRQAYPELWAMIQNNLANAYIYRIRGERADNIEQATGHCGQALAIFTRQAYPKDWAMTQNTLANAYSKRILGKHADNLERAIEYYQHALEVYTRQAYPAKWAMIQHNLANAYRDRIRGERADNLEHAIGHCEQALAVYTHQAYPEQWAMIQNNLANAYRDRIRSGRADNMEQAIEHYEQALEVYTRQAYLENWAMTQNNLANAYFYRIRGERADNLERAIEHHKQALEVRTRQAYPEDWAMTQHNLANAYRDRIHGVRSDNLERAIKHYEQVLEVYTHQAYPEQWAMTQNNLATAYSDRILGERVDNLKRAIECYNQALAVKTLEEFPSDFQQTQRNLSELYFREARWGEAYTACQQAIRAEKVLLAEAYTETGRQSEVAQTAALYARAAYALLKLGRAGESLVQLEQGKTRLLSRALALDEVDVSLLPALQQETLSRLRRSIRELETEMRLPPDTPAWRGDRVLADALRQARSDLTATIEAVRAVHPEFMPEGLELTEILALIPSGAALVAPVVTSHGSAVFVVPAGEQALSLDHVLWVEDFKGADLKTMLQGTAEKTDLGGWLGAYFHARNDAQAWLDCIETTGRMLWDRMLAPIAERLAALEAIYVLLFPQGGLGLLPLHAAWREVDDRRRYFLDDYSVSYLPSAYALHVSRERLGDLQRHERTLFAVVNPTRDLPFTPTEGEQVLRLFGDQHSRVLLEDDAKPEAVKQAEAGYLHFSCHGFYRWDDPMQSGLLLANGEPFTLAQIIGHLNLESTRLVTLSACETGITDILQSPDEYLGLPAGFMQAGAPAVVSTLWAVNDLSTMLLMERFYQLHLQQGIAIPDALRQAQIWLRDVTAGKLAERFADEEEALLAKSRMPIETASVYFDRFAGIPPEQRPFAHPYYWAAFIFSGA